MRRWSSCDIGVYRRSLSTQASQLAAARWQGHTALGQPTSLGVTVPQRFYIAMACIVTNYVFMAYIVMAYIVMAYIFIASIVMAYAFMALYSYGSTLHLKPGSSAFAEGIRRRHASDVVEASKKRGSARSLLPTMPRVKFAYARRLAMVRGTAMVGCTPPSRFLSASTCKQWPIQ